MVPPSYAFSNYSTTVYVGLGMIRTVINHISTAQGQRANPVAENEAGPATSRDVPSCGGEPLVGSGHVEPRHREVSSIGI